MSNSTVNITLVDDPTFNAITAKKAKKQEARSVKDAAAYAGHKEAIAKGEKKLVVEREPNGLYWCRFEGGGVMAAELKGKFTSIDKLRTLAELRYGAGILK